MRRIKAIRIPRAAAGCFILTALALGCAGEGAKISSVPQPGLASHASRVNPAKVRSDDPIWRRAYKEVDASQDQLETQEAQSSQGHRSPMTLHKVWGTGKVVALTFDDGPHPQYTGRLLEILKKEKVPAAFFVIGFMAEKHPNLVKAIAAAGHDIGNHTYSHATLTKLSQEEVLTEYQAANDAIKQITGKAPRFCRPPGGDFNRAVLEAGAALGLTTVLWTNDPGDYSNPGDDVLLKREVAKLKPGAIILLHDGSKDTLDTLARFIQIAKLQGFRFVRLRDLKPPVSPLMPSRTAPKSLVRN